VLVTNNGKFTTEKERGNQKKPDFTTADAR
jgi:hypothetical protein